jgi:hypothetical protein
MRMRLQPGDLQVRRRGDLTSILWRQKCDLLFLTNIHDPQREVNFRDSNGKAIKSQIVGDYNRHMGYVGNADRMQIPILSTVAHRSGQRHSSSICLIWPF